MSQGLVERQNLEDIADAIRSKNGSSDTYTPAEMAQAISGIHTADEVVLVQKTVNANGQYNASDDSADGYSGVRVNVPNSYSASDEGKVVSNGDLVAQTSKNINANGTHDTTANNSVVVDVPNSYLAADEGKVVSGGTLVGQTSRNISENGTFDTTLNNEVVVSAHADPVLYKFIDYDYYMDTTGLICTLNGREYNKTYADPAFVTYCYNGSYTGALLLSKTSNGATITTIGYTSIPSQATIDGEMWYVNYLNYAIPGDIVSSNGFAKKLTDTYSTQQLAVEALYQIAYNGSIKQNGNYTIPTGYDGFGAFSVDVAPDLETKYITENGTYTPTEGKDGFSVVTVNVSGGGGEQEDDPFALTEYIESSGTQYINTGYSVTDNTRLELVANASITQPTYATMFGVRSSNDDNPSSHSCILAATWTSNLGNVNWGSSINRLTSYDKGHKTNYIISKTNYSADIDGVGLVANFTGSTESASIQPLFLFTLGLNGNDYGSITHCNMKLYRFRIYESGVLVHEYLPFIDGNNVVCLHDTISGNNLYNIGTGVFTYGTDGE